MSKTTMARKQLMSEIFSKFHGKPLSIPWRSYQPGQEGWDETNFFRNRDWADLSIADFNGHPYCLSFFDVGAFPFFFGGIMFVSLRDSEFECRPLENFLIMWEDFGEFGLIDGPSSEIAEKVADNLRGILTKEQIGTIADYFSFRESCGIDYDAASVRAFLSSLQRQPAAGEQ